MQLPRAATFGLIAGIISAVVLPIAAQQTTAQTSTTQPELRLTTPYPAQSVEAGESVTLPLKVRMTGMSAQIVNVAMERTPTNWSSSFIGNGRTVGSVFTSPDSAGSMRLKLDLPDGVESGTYRFTAVARARSSDHRAELPLSLQVEAPQPPQLSLDVQLPTLRGTADGTLTYKATLANDGDQDLTVNLSANAPDGFQVTFKERFGGKQVSRLPVAAGESKDLDIDVHAPSGVSAGEYAIDIRAEADGAQVSRSLIAAIQPQASLSVASAQGPYSTGATIGQSTAIDFIVRNTGNAPAENVSVNASSPSGWTVEFQPSEIGTILPNGKTEVTAQVQPSDNTIAGDYFVTLTADAGGDSASKEWRVSAKMSTIWGAVGIVLIGVALGVVGIAVVRYGRR